MSDPDNWVDTAIQRAQALGKEHGHNAAGWWIQEVLTNAHDSQERAAMTIAYDENCQESSIPHADLSGQWADGVSSKDVLDEALANGGWDGDDRPEVADEAILQAYEEAFDATAHNECIAACQNELAS